MSVENVVSQGGAAGVARVYAENTVPAKPSYPYVVLGLSHGAPGAATSDGHSHVTRWLTAKVYSRTVDQLTATSDQIDAAFNGRALPLDGSPVAEFLQANQMSRDADDNGVLGTVLTYRY